MIQQLLCFLFSIWIECTSASFVETAEHLIIFQTKYLNTYDQSFESAYEQVAEDYSEPVRISAFSAGQLKYYFMIAAWLTANAPIRIKEIVFEK